MKVFKTSVFLVALIVLASCTPKPTKMGYKLVWEENFKDSTKLEENWSKIPRGKSDWNDYMSNHNSLYVVENGMLTLRGIKNTVDPNDEAPYLTGGIYTKGKRTFDSGRIEVKARLFGSRGAWPAIWMLPEDGEEWPTSGEIDIMERINVDTYMYQTVHSDYTVKEEITDDPKSAIVAHLNLDKFNVYAVELFKDSLKFFVNDTHTFTYPRIETDIPGQFPFSENKYHLLIDMQLGGNWSGDVNEQDLPAKMEIEWVRHFEREEPKAKK